MSKINNLFTAVQEGDITNALDLVQQAIDEGNDPAAILAEGLIAPLDVVCEKFINNEIVLSEMLMSVVAMNMCIEVVEPLLAEDVAQGKSLVVVGTVAGDIYDINCIGRDLVKLTMKGKRGEAGSNATAAAKVPRRVA